MKLFKRNTDVLEVTISNRTIIRVVGLVVTAFILLLAVRQAAHALTLIVIAFFLALALNAPVHRVANLIPGKRKGNRTLATTLSFLVVVLFLGTVIASLVPLLVKQTSSLVDALPGLISDLRDTDTSVGRFVEKYQLESQVDNISEQAATFGTNVANGAISTVGKVGGGIVSTLTVLVITFMMLIEGPKWISVARRLTPDDKEAHLESLARSMYKVIKGYVNGQVILAFFAAVLILPVFIIMNVSYPFALVFVVFICGLIPMVGHSIGAMISTLVALFTSPLAAIVVLGYYILYQQIENYAVQPKVQSNSTNMSPLLVFVSVVIGVNFSGLLGGLLAIPVAGCLRIVLLDYLFRKNLLSKKESIDLEIVKETDLPDPKEI